MDTITITFENGEKKEYRRGVKFSEVINDIRNDYKFDIISGKLKNQTISYDDSIVKSEKLYLYDINTKQGNKIYERGLIYLFITCCKDILGSNTKIIIKHSIDRGIYCELDKEVSELNLKLIKDKMREKVEKGIPFIKVETSRLEAIEYFKKQNRDDKVKSLFYNTSQFITLYKFDGIYDYVLGELPHDASILKYFDLTAIANGIVLRFPSIYDNGKIIKYTHHGKYFDSLKEYSSLSNLLGIGNLGELNEKIINTSPGELINLSEIIQDYKLLTIAEKICLNSNNLKFVLISGPSSSGKTTTSKKLSLYLKASGLNPIRLSIDDYYVNREDTPKDENGNPDYESIRAVDVKMFNDHLEKLLNGQKVNTPVFDFILGKKTFCRPIQITENDVLVIEGLHALNDELTTSIPKKNKYRIYISPLAWLNVDNDNRISITDIRLLRRMVRDNRTRGYTPSQTLNRWSEVRKGEEKYVFPYQDSADVIFNTFLGYELAVLKTYVEPLLFSVKEDDTEYLTAIRLIEMLKFVLPLPSVDVPYLSILREFIGGSFFENDI